MLRTSRARTLRWVSALGCGLALLAVGACSGPVSTDNTVVVRDVSVSPSLIEEGDVAVVEVLITNESGEALANRTVYLVAEPNVRGSFQASVLETDDNGIAATTFTATQSGAVTISARAEGAEDALNVNLTIEGGGVTTGDGQIVVTITPGLLQADGLSQATVTAKVYNAQGDPMPDSTLVKFTAGEKFVDINGDGFWTANIDSLVYDTDGDDLWDPIGNIQNNVYTSNGQASTSYTAGVNAGLVYIKATMGEPGSHLTQDVSLSLTSNDSINTIALTPEWQEVQVRGTGGIEWAKITAQAFDAHGNPAPEGLPIDFNITSGPGGGESIDGDPIGPVTVMTNSLGMASVTLNSGSVSGTIRLRARSGAVVSAATQVTIRSGPPAFVSVGAEDCNVPSWELVNHLNRITAVVLDQWGNEVADSTQLWFGTEQGLIEGESHTQAAVTFRGVAETWWHSGAPKNDGYVWYWCETSGGTVADTSVFIESGPAASGTYLQWPDTLYADGKSKGEVVIQVLDVNGVFMDSDTPIEVDALYGQIGGGLLNDGCHSSIYAQNYFAPTLDRDYEYTIPDSGVGAIDVIKARAGGYFGFNGTAQIVLLTGAAFGDNSIIDVPTSMSYGITVPVNIKIKDRWGNPLGGHLIEVTTDPSGGTITGSPQYTDSYGVASGFKFTGTTNQLVSSAFITMEDLDPNYGGISKTIKISFEEE
ncbi:MAG: hypothetical protein GF341_04885 [candidate division Zixibacteria bacterium]|nr:hypothetical protein [candidate division Zixibacteria bacterium]